jgi:hypothetical protein
LSRGTRGTLVSPVASDPRHNLGSPGAAGLVALANCAPFDSGIVGSPKRVEISKLDLSSADLSAVTTPAPAMALVGGETTSLRDWAQTLVASGQMGRILEPNNATTSTTTSISPHESAFLKRTGPLLAAALQQNPGRAIDEWLDDQLALPVPSNTSTVLTSPLPSFRSRQVQLDWKIAELLQTTATLPHPHILRTVLAALIIEWICTTRAFGLHTRALDMLKPVLYESIFVDWQGTCARDPDVPISVPFQHNLAPRLTPLLLIHHHVTIATTFIITCICFGSLQSSFVFFVFFCYR